ncbi:hypothetical protein [Kitasatospora paranensis]|uniref:Lipoprotein n=1 Tax=Kitasatospora paranensis TaxID=258053 RepID=A0ABW2FPB5_9ACTN
MDERWEPPWRYEWEQPTGEAVPPPAAPAPAPRPRRAAGTTAAALGGVLMVLAAALVTCGPSGGDDGALTAVASPTPTERLRPAHPSPGAASGSAAPPVASAGTPGPDAAAVPDASPSDGSDPADADGPATAPSRRPVRPAPVRTARGSGSGHGTRPVTVPPLTGLKVCAAAERQGQWLPGSAQARACRSLYGG